MLVESEPARLFQRRFIYEEVPFRARRALGCRLNGVGVVVGGLSSVSVDGLVQ